MNKISIVLIALVLATTILAAGSALPALAKKSTEYQAGYRDGAVAGQKAADCFDAGQSSGVSGVKKEIACPGGTPDYCKGYKDGFSAQVVAAED